MRGLLLLAMAAVPQYGQTVPSVRAGTTEVGVFTGVSYGLENFRGMVGANVGYGLTKVIFPYAEFSYLPGITREDTVPGSSIPQQFRIPITDFHGGLHIRVPIPESRFVPYGIIGLGLVRAGETTASFTIPRPGLPDLTVTNDIPSSTNFAVNGGGGVRVYLKETVGVRLEGKAYRPTGQFTKVFYRFAAGVFFQF